MRVQDRWLGVSRSGAAIAVVVIVQATRSLVAYACSCLDRTTAPAEMIANYSLVFAGTVVSIEKPSIERRQGCRSDEEAEEYDRVTFVVDESFRGAKAGEEIVVTHPAGTSCSLSLARGDRLVLAVDPSYAFIGYCTPHLTLGVGATYTYCVPDQTKGTDSDFSYGCWGDDDPVMLTEEELLDALRAASGS